MLNLHLPLQIGKSRTVRRRRSSRRSH